MIPSVSHNSNNKETQAGTLPTVTQNARNCNTSLVTQKIVNNLDKSKSPPFPSSFPNSISSKSVQVINLEDREGGEITQVINLQDQLTNQNSIRTQVPQRISSLIQPTGTKPLNTPSRPTPLTTFIQNQINHQAVPTFNVDQYKPYKNLNSNFLPPADKRPRVTPPQVNNRQNEVTRPSTIDKNINSDDDLRFRVSIDGALRELGTSDQSFKKELSACNKTKLNLYPEAIPLFRDVIKEKKEVLLKKMNTPGKYFEKDGNLFPCFDTVLHYADALLKTKQLDQSIQILKEYSNYLGSYSSLLKLKVLTEIFLFKGNVEGVVNSVNDLILSINNIEKSPLIKEDFDHDFEMLHLYSILLNQMNKVEESQKLKELADKQYMIAKNFITCPYENPTETGLSNGYRIPIYLRNATDPKIQGLNKLNAYNDLIHYAYTLCFLKVDYSRVLEIYSLALDFEPIILKNYQTDYHTRIKNLFQEIMAWRLGQVAKHTATKTITF